jgi:hypothetical protein
MQHRVRRARAQLNVLKSFLNWLLHRASESISISDETMTCITGIMLSDGHIQHYNRK